ncbi:MAG: hypothetical protein IT290_02750 [Deltaproteobacteria bacterium]|nr:hypothetical protein [Deltaproteobacteria bacterium]
MESGTLHERMSARRSLLRRMLQNCPAWPRGHVELGLAELESIRTGGAASPGSTHVLTLCGQAALSLLRGESDAQPLRDQAELLQALGSYYSRDFEKALSSLQSCVTSATLPDALRAVAHEYAGLSAFILEDREAALHFLTPVPESHLSGEARDVLRRLHESSSTPTDSGSPD